MKKKLFAEVLLAVLVLSGCGQSTAASGQTATEEEAARPGAAELEFVENGVIQTTPATLYLGEGYSVYIPDTGWKLEQELDDGVPEDTWESTADPDAKLTVSRYSNAKPAGAITAFLEQHDDYAFEELRSGEVAKEPLTGVDEDGDVLEFVTRENDTGTYMISWEYPSGAETLASQLEQMAGTFVLAQPVLN